MSGTFGGFGSIMRDLPMVGTIMTALQRSESRRHSTAQSLESIGYGAPARKKSERSRSHPTKKRVPKSKAKAKRKMQKASRKANR